MLTECFQSRPIWISFRNEFLRTLVQLSRKLVGFVMGLLHLPLILGPVEKQLPRGMKLVAKITIFSWTFTLVHATLSLFLTLFFLQFSMLHRILERVRNNLGGRQRL